MTDPSTADTIVSRAKITPEDTVLEIGAGLGALTMALSRSTDRVYAVEIDRNLIPLLETELETHGIENVSIIQQDILSVDWLEIEKMAGRKLVVFGNLPYNISSQVLVHLIQSRSAIQRAILMFQKELAQRISANPGKRNYGRISVMLQSCAEIRPLMEVKAAQFFPKPKVDSEIIEIIFNPWMDRHVENETFFFNVIKAAFSKRRKTLKNALGTSRFFEDAKAAAPLLNDIGIDPIRRAETLAKEEFAKLSNAIYGMGK